MRVNRENEIMHLPDAAWRIAYFNLCVKEDENKEKKKKVKEKRKLSVQDSVEWKLDYDPLKHLHEGSPLWYSDSMIISAFFFRKAVYC